MAEQPPLSLDDLLWDHSGDALHNEKEADHNLELQFPCGRVWNNMEQTMNYEAQPEAAVFLAAVMEFMTSELLQLSTNEAIVKDKMRIEPPHILSAIHMNNDWIEFFNEKNSETNDDHKLLSNKSRQSAPASPFEQSSRNSTRDTKSKTFFGGNDKSPLEFIIDENTDEKSEEIDETAIFNINDHKTFISGMFYLEDFINDTQQNEIVSYLYNNEWDKLDTRIVQNYGYCHDKDRSLFKKISKQPFDKIPSKLLSVFNVFLKDLEFDQLTVDNFPSFGGDELGLEDYDHFDECVIVISLLHECVMDFQDIQTHEFNSLLLKPKSLLLLSGDARYLWKRQIKQSEFHEIDGIKIHRKNRISLTFRKTLEIDDSNIQTSKDQNTNVNALSHIDALIELLSLSQ